MEKIKKDRSNKLSPVTWSVIWVAGLAGQLCWNIENQWFNTFVYAKIAPDPSIISWMVAVSAIVSTFSTFLSGTGSDRLGRRKPFISWGYILWGVFTIVFGLTEYLPFKGNVLAMATIVVFADAIMSFFGSLGNDAGFNPWTTDITNESNRGGLGAVIAVQPVIATIVGSLLGGFIISSLGYIWFFVIMGTFVIAVGIYSIFVVKEGNIKPAVDEKGFWHQFGKAFNFKLLWKNKMLLIVLCIFAVFFISFNVYFPHILNMFIYTYSYDVSIAGVLLGVGLVAAIPLTIIAGRFINKKKFVAVSSIAVGLNLIGIIVMILTQFASGVALTVTIILATFFIGGGYMVFYQTLMIWCKNLYPEEQRGQLEGVRIFFYVLIPMVFGPMIANPVIKKWGKPVTLYYDNVGIAGFAPSVDIMYAALAVVILTFVPIYIAYRYEKKLKNNEILG